MARLVLTVQISVKAKHRLDNHNMAKPLWVDVDGIQYLAEVLDYEIKE